MCTLTAVRLGRWDTGEFRVVVNRDEQRTRAAALPPIVRRCAGMEAILPIDPGSGGTWIAANSAGVVLALLNATPIGGLLRRQHQESRGVIVPSILGCTSAGEAVRRALEVDPTRFPAFRLVAIDAESIGVVASDGTESHVQTMREFRDPFMATSSSLGDHVVEWPRRELFVELVRSTADHAAAQDVFHEHRWGDRAHVSVRMSRRDARTVSRTAVEVLAGTISMNYRSLEDDGCEQPRLLDACSNDRHASVATARVRA
ncbi:MAG TPA: NRDE family protein [Phycisphaerales bacterium]